MAFEHLDCIKPKGVSKALAAPDDGVAVSTRQLTSRKGVVVRYIRVQIGAKLARAILLTQQNHGLRVAFGTGEDAGKIMVSVDNQGGGFQVSRDAKGRYVLTINAATAQGLFALNFPPFTRDRIEALRPDNGKPPHFVFTASPEMLAVDAD